MEIMHA